MGSTYRLVKTRKWVPQLQARLDTLKDKLPQEHAKFQARLDLYAQMQPPIGKAEFRALQALKVEIDQAVQRPPTDVMLGLQAVREAHQKAAVHNARYARNVEQARSAAVRIVDAGGHLLLDAAQGWDNLPVVQGMIAVSEESKLPQSVHAVKMLQKLQDRQELQEVIHSIKAPNPDGPACELIRSVLGLPADFPVGKVEARRAALSCMLTKLRQHDVASCFATSVAIQAQEKIPDVFLKDIKSLIETGTIVRSRTPPNKPVAIPRAGSTLHETAAFQQALDKLGVPQGERQEAVDAALATLRQGLDPNLTEDRFTPVQVLAAVQKARPVDQSAEALEAATDAYREVGKVVMPLNPDASRSDLTTPVGIPRADSKFHETPAIVAALDALGVPAAAMEKSVNEALDVLRGGRDPALTEDTFAPEQILDMIGALRGVSDVDKSKQELDAAKLAFQSQQDNLLLRAWEYTVASMAELGEDRGKEVREPVLQACGNAMSSLEATLLAEGHDAKIVSQFLDDAWVKFENLFVEQVAIRYDASVVIPKTEDGSSSAGAWVMRRTKDDSKVNDQASQEKLVRELMAEAAKEFQGTDKEDWAKRLRHPEGERPFTVEELKDGAARVISRVKRASEEKTFSDGPPPQASGAYVAGTEELLAAFYDNAEPVQMEIAQPKDATDLLGWMLDQAKALGGGLRADVPEGATLPMTGGPHAFSMKLGAQGLGALVGELKDGQTAQDLVAKYADKHKGAKDVFRVLDPHDESTEVMGLVAKACAGLDPSWAEVVKQRLLVRYNRGDDDISLAELKGEIDADFADVYAPYLAGQRQAKKARSRDGLGRHLLADTSPGAPTVALDLNDDSRLMGLVTDALAVCGPEGGDSLVDQARQRLGALGADPITLAQLKALMDETIKAAHKKRLEAELEAVQNAPDVMGKPRKRSALMMDTWMGMTLGADATPELVQDAMDRLPKEADAMLTFADLQSAAKAALESVRSAELEQKQQDDCAKAGAQFAQTVSNWEALLDESNFDLSADAPRTKLDPATAPALARLDALLDTALAGLGLPDLPQMKKTLWASLEKHADAVSLAQVRDELAKLLSEDEPAAAAAKRNFGKALLADTSAMASTVPFDLADRSRLMSLVSNGLSGCEPGEVAGLIQAAKQSLTRLGTATVTLAQVKQVIAEQLEANFEASNPVDDGDVPNEQKLKDLLAKGEEDLADTVGNWDMLLADSTCRLASTPRDKLDATIDAALAHLDPSLVPEKKKLLWNRLEKLGSSVSLADLHDELDRLFDEDQKKADEASAKETRDGMLSRLAGAVVEAQTPKGTLPGIVFADSNWEAGDSDNEIHFIMIVNPLTDELEMWQVNADGSKPVPMDQDQWVKQTGKKAPIWAVPKNASQAGPLV